MNLRKLAESYGTPLYVYDQRIIEGQFRRLENALAYEPKRLYYAAKANNNVHLLKLMRRLGAFLDASSPGEIWLALQAGFKPGQILFTGNNLTESELRFAIERKIFMNLDSLSQLVRVGKISPGLKVGIRVNPSFGAGMHSHVITAGPTSRFGIAPKELKEARRIAANYGLEIVGLHQSIGSGILAADKFLKAVDILLGIAKNFDGLEFVDFGGGLGTPYRPEEKPLNLAYLGAQLSKKFKRFCAEQKRKLILCLEPGRFFVASAGTLLVQATVRKRTPAGEEIIGTDSGMNHLIRPALYGSYHKIVNVSNPGGRKETVTVVGNICESTDSFAKGRSIAKVREGDILAIKNAGAYGLAMASRFNGRLLPAEILVSGKKVNVIRQRDTFKDLLPRS